MHFPAVERRTGTSVDWASSADGLLLSVNGSRHFGETGRETRWRPFVTGGLSVLAGGEPLGSFNAGVGVDRWITSHTGLRLEVRDEMIGALLGFRVGLVFR